MNQNPNDKPSTEQQERPANARGTGFFAVVQSVLAAGLGVQSRKNRERDFNQGRPIHFILGGLIGTLIFIFVIVLIVRLVLSQAH